MELHPEDSGLLRQHLARHDNVAIHERDAYEGLTALIPPKEKRGLVLIDPPYEEERDDYAPVVKLLQKAHAKWPTGMYAIWFPIKDRHAITRFYRRLRDSGIPKLLTTELCVLPPDNRLGLNGTGMVIVNPPWQFDADCRKLLAWLTPVLSDHKQAEWTVEWLAREATAAKPKSRETTDATRTAPAARQRRQRPSPVQMRIYPHLHPRIVIPAMSGARVTAAAQALNSCSQQACQRAASAPATRKLPLRRPGRAL